MNANSVRPKLGSTLLFSVMLAGVFLATLDMHVTNAILPILGQDLGASSDQLAVIQTVYLTAEMVTMALARPIISSLSARGGFAAASATFALSSLFCAIATDISMLLVSRFIQGLAAGLLIPIAFQARFRLFNADQQMVVGSIVILVISCAPSFGPAVGAWLTEVSSWRFIFAINVPFAVLVCVIVAFGKQMDVPEERTDNPFPWSTAYYLCLALISFHIVLDAFVRNLALISVYEYGWMIVLLSSTVMFAVHNSNVASRVIDFGLLSSRTFSVGLLFAALLGIIHFSLIFVIPIYFQVVVQASLQEVSLIILIAGLAQMLSAPIIWMTPNLLTPRRMIPLGFILMGSGVLLYTRVTPEWGFDEMFWPQILRGLSFMLLAIPAQNMVMSSVEKTSIGDASVLYNISQNLASTLGLAAVSVYVQKVHDQILASGSVSAGEIWSSPNIYGYSTADVFDQFSYSVAYHNVFIILILCLGFMAVIFAINRKNDK